MNEIKAKNAIRNIIKDIAFSCIRKKDESIGCFEIEKAVGRINMLIKTIIREDKEK